MDDVWRMTVADRRWWIHQTIDAIKKQNDANSGKSQHPGMNNRTPEQMKAAQEMIQNYKRLSSHEDN